MVQRLCIFGLYGAIQMLYIIIIIFKVPFVVKISRIIIITVQWKAARVGKRPAKLASIDNIITSQVNKRKQNEAECKCRRKCKIKLINKK